MQCTMFLLHSVFVLTYLLNVTLFVFSEKNVTRVSEGIGPGISENKDNVARTEVDPLPLEGGGTVVAAATPSSVPKVVSSSIAEGDKSDSLSASTTALPVVVDFGSSSTHAPSNVSQKMHTLADETKHTDMNSLLETSDGGAKAKVSSIVARKGAPSEAPGVVEDDSSSEVQSLFADDIKNISAVSVCSNTTLIGNAGSNNCSQNEHEKSPTAYETSTAAVDAAVTITTTANTSIAVSRNISTNHSETALRKQPGNPTVLKPAVLHELGSAAVHNSSVIKLSPTQNITSRKKFKPALTFDMDESKEQSSPTDTPASKGDYIIPIIGIILAVPMVVILFMFFYKRSAEFWERRHYKRMDFLIDGMYND